MTEYGVSLTVTTSDHQGREKAQQSLAEVAKQLSVQFARINFSSYLIDENETVLNESDEYFDEITIFKVLKALTDGGVTLGYAHKLTQSMQNAGILFREYSRARYSTPKVNDTLRCVKCGYYALVTNADLDAAHQDLYRHYQEEHNLEEKSSRTCPYCKHGIYAWESGKADEELHIHIRENHSDKE